MISGKAAIASYRNRLKNSGPLALLMFSVASSPNPFDDDRPVTWGKADKTVTPKCPVAQPRFNLPAPVR